MTLKLPSGVHISVHEAALVDFAGVLVEGWNIGWDGDWYSNGGIFDFTKSFPDFDLGKVTTYGQSKNVELIGHRETSGSVTNYRKQMGDAFDLYQKHGVTRVKTGYVTDGARIKRIDGEGIARYEWHDGQFTVMVLRYVLKPYKLGLGAVRGIATTSPVTCPVLVYRYDLVLLGLAQRIEL